MYLERPLPKGCLVMPSYEERILSVIEESKVGLTTVDVARKAKVSKTTAIKYLSVLKSEGKCEFVEVGPSKLWRVKKTDTEKAAGTFREETAGTQEEVHFGDTALPLSVIAQLEDISDDLVISMSFRVKPENADTFIKLIKKCTYHGTQDKLP